MSAALVKQMPAVPMNTNAPTAAALSREFLEQQAVEAFRALICGPQFRAFVGAMQGLVTNTPTAPASTPHALDEPPSEAAASDVMTVAEAAAFLGVNRNTVYEFAARGVIPHQKMGKRIILRRGGLVAWLDKSLCETTPTKRAT